MIAEAQGFHSLIDSSAASVRATNTITITVTGPQTAKIHGNTSVGASGTRSEYGTTSRVPFGKMRGATEMNHKGADNKIEDANEARSFIRPAEL
jgi:hypothetical protein